jgi:hypothetical protein
VSSARVAIVISAVFTVFACVERNARADDQTWNAVPARVGFQLALRTGFSAPLGSIGNGTKLARTFGDEVPLVLEVGAKIQRHIFVGGSFGFGVGGCNETPECTALTARLGPEIIVDVLPSSKVDPWIGYGIGFEYAQASSNPSATYRGWELGHFMAGVDFRFSEVFGVGPFADLSLAEFTHGSIDVADVTGGGGAIAQDVGLDHSLHEWLTLGVRFVIFP